MKISKTRNQNASLFTVCISSPSITNDFTPRYSCIYIHCPLLYIYMMSFCSCLHFSSPALTALSRVSMLVSATEANESLLFTRGGVLAKGGLFFWRGLCRVNALGFEGRDKRVKEPRGEDVLEVEVDEDDVFAGGLVTGSFPWY